MTELIDGQIYRWRWADKGRDDDNAPYRAYHCKSKIAVVKGGRLYDTFWSDYSRALGVEDVVLTPFANELWPQISEYEVRYYDSADVADTRHSNNSRAPIYLRPGAVRSAAAIAQEIDWLEERTLSNIRSAERTLEWIRSERAKLDSGDLGGVMLPVVS